MSDRARLGIVGTWLVEEVDECTGGACGLGYGHEPGCGQEPIVDLSTVPGWGALISARLSSARSEELDDVAAEFERSANRVVKVKGETERTRYAIEVVEVLRNRAAEIRRAP